MKKIVGASIAATTLVAWLVLPFAMSLGATSSLPTSTFGIDASTATGTQVGGKTAADTMLLDSAGNALGTSASPIVVSAQATALGAAGKQFLGTTGALTLTAAGSFRALLTNPAGSGVTLIINALTAVNSNLNLTAVATFLYDPTTALPTTDVYRTNFVLGGANAKATLKADANALGTLMTGGTTIMTVGVPPGRTVYNQGFFYLSPGHSIGMNIPYAGIGMAELAIYWSEL